MPGQCGRSAGLLEARGWDLERSGVGGESVVGVAIAHAFGCRDGAGGRGEVQAREEDR